MSEERPIYLEYTVTDEHLVLRLVRGDFIGSEILIPLDRLHPQGRKQEPVP